MKQEFDPSSLFKCVLYKNLRVETISEYISKYKLNKHRIDIFDFLNRNYGKEVKNNVKMFRNIVLLDNLKEPEYSFKTEKYKKIIDKALISRIKKECL